MSSSGPDQLGTDQLVVVLAEVDRDHAGLAGAVVVAEAGLLDQAVAGREHEVGLLVVVADRQDLGDVLVGLEAQESGDVAALRVARRLGEVVRLGAVDPAGGGEEQQPVVVGGGHQVLDDVVAAQRRAAHALPATLLRAVGVGAGALGVAAAGDRDDELLVGDQVLHGEVAVGSHDLGPAVVAVLLHDLGQLVADDLSLPGVAGEDVLEVGDGQLEVGEAVDDRLALQGREPAQLQVEDRLRLDLVDLEELHQARPRVLDVGRPPDQGDHLVEGVERLDQTPLDVGQALRLGQAEAGAPLDDVDLVGHPVADELVDGQRARHAVDQRQHVGAEVRLELGVLEQVVEDDPRHRVAPEHHDETLAGAAGRVVANVRDALDLAGVGQLGDLQGEVVGVDHVGELGDRQAGAALGVLVDLDDRALRHRPTAGAVGLLDALTADDQRAVGEVGTLDPLDQRVLELLAGGVGVVERPARSVGDLTQVVGRDVGGHPDRDPGGAVDEQVGVAGRQDDRLLRATVVVGLEVDGVLVDVADHLEGQGSHPALGVAHRGGGVVARGAEVALAVDQRGAHHPGLREADQGVVDRGVAVGVVLAHHVADHARALGESPVRAVAAVEHRVEHAPVDRLQPVAYVGQRAADDDRHRVVDVGALHRRLQLDRLDASARAFGGGLSHVSGSLSSHLSGI